MLILWGFLNIHSARCKMTEYFRSRGLTSPQLQVSASVESTNWGSTIALFMRITRVNSAKVNSVRRVSGTYLVLNEHLLLILV